MDMDIDLYLKLFSVTELAQLESAISGILAGFALTTVILLLEQERKITKGIEYEYSIRAISLFLTVFFTALVASFLYASLGAIAFPDCLKTVILKTM